MSNRISLITLAIMKMMIHIFNRITFQFMKYDDIPKGVSIDHHLHPNNKKWTLHNSQYITAREPFGGG